MNRTLFEAVLDRLYLNLRSLYRETENFLAKISQLTVFASTNSLGKQLYLNSSSERFRLAIALLLFYFEFLFELFDHLFNWLLSFGHLLKQ